MSIQRGDNSTKTPESALKMISPRTVISSLSCVDFILYFLKIDDIIAFSSSMANFWPVKNKYTCISKHYICITISAIKTVGALFFQLWWWCPLCTRPSCLMDLYSASSLKQQSTNRHIAPLWNIILITSQPVFVLTP